MNRNDILDFLKANKEEICQKYGVKKIGLFGSYARGEAKEDSDIDIVVEIEEINIFRNFFALEQYLKLHLQKNVDMGTESSIKPAAKKRIMDEIIYV
ncbi:Nucleotidyltransferase domain-containing protein [Desulfonema limicola]|uniref:Nucleotidyltransferase domain-containing protein n=1 Tax=Desulfonema limicola TaxID=45656 RepID=A0A975B5N5_9BACT|nr:nucleotidyltransferase family protein [Desulfonema limicola]QTA79232.1 Nucleotidyltransferase domain-containing protein [Desulfonema limicola]